ncbi:MAG: glycosyltransferase [Opitutales bacterium]
MKTPLGAAFAEPASRAKLCHVVRHWPCGGGMESTLRPHFERGERLLAIAPAEDGVNALEARPDRSWREAASRLSNVLPRPPALFIHHNGYSLPLLAPRFPTARHLVWMHTDYPRGAAFRHWAAPWADGFIEVHPALLESHRRAQRARWYVPYAVQPPADLAARRAVARPEPTIGLISRLEVEQKRLDRLDTFVRRLDATGRPYRLEVLGDGTLAEALEARFASHPRVHFFGTLRGADYWERLLRWRHVVFLSDFEGLPIALLEAVAAGAFPLYPAFHGEHEWTASFAPEGLYPPGDLDALVRAWMATSGRERPRTAFLEGSAERLRAHTAERHFAAFDRALVELMARPKRPASRARPLFTGSLPLWTYHRLYNWKRYGRRRVR